MKKNLSFLTVLWLLFTPLAMQAQTGAFNLATGTGTGSGWTWSDPVLTVNGGANIEITGTVTGGRRIVIATGATASITLNGVSITGMPPGTGTYEYANACPLWLNSGSTLNLTLAGSNTLSAGQSGPGIRCEDDATLVITAQVQER